MTITYPNLEGGLIGIAPDGIAEYSYERCVEYLMSQEDWSYLDAIEWMNFNVVPMHVGPETPRIIFEEEEEG